MGPLGEIISGCQSDSPNARRWSPKDDYGIEEIGDAMYHDHWVTAVTSRSAGLHGSFPEVYCFL